MAEAHLVGSMNLPDAETVFRVVGEHAGSSLRAVPDGERGRRAGWIVAQAPILAANPQLQVRDTIPAYAGDRPRLVPADGVAVEDILIDLPYAEDGAESYAVFRRLRDQEGVLPAGTRLQVSIPSAVATLLPYIESDHHDALLPRIEASLAAQIERLVAAVPTEDLAIQWDLAVEFNALETELGRSTTYGFDELFASAARLAAFVPDGVELGYHLCYGDAPPAPGAKGKHFVEPRDAGLLTDAANRLAATVDRRIDFIHLPVPIERRDEDYVAPLGRLALSPDTRLYLGLVHEEDGLDGATARAATAAKFVTGFGVGTECGLQNEPPEAIGRILRIQRDLEIPAGRP